MEKTLKNKKLFIFDMDGTIYLGGKPFKEAIDFIDFLRQSGRNILFFTNNASHNKKFYINKLNKLGFNAKDDELMSSADVTMHFLKTYRKDKKVYLLGTPELYEQFLENGINLVNDVSGNVIDNQKADIVVSSFDTTLTYNKLVIACDFIRYGAEFLSTHPDYNCPTETGFVPDSGAITALITASTDKTPRYFGKPYEDTVNMIASVYGYTKDDMAIIGDRLYTDIATGKKHGMTAILTMTGETTREMLEMASKENYPDIVVNDLSELAKLL